VLLAQSVAMQIIATPAVSGGPHATDTRMWKKPIVWPVRSSAMIMIEASPSAYH
jgi:hypothetical protein